MRGVLWTIQDRCTAFQIRDLQDTNFPTLFTVAFQQARLKVFGGIQGSLSNATSPIKELGA